MGEIEVRIWPRLTPRVETIDIVIFSGSEVAS